MSDDADIERSKDRKGSFYQAVGDDRKFYYEPGNAESRREAKALAKRRARQRSGS